MLEFNTPKISRNAGTRKSRSEPQGVCGPNPRLMGLSLVVGVIAGLGAVVFFLACQIVSHYALDEVAGYRPHAPGGEPPVFEETARPTFWLRADVFNMNGIISGLHRPRQCDETRGMG